MNNLTMESTNKNTEEENSLTSDYLAAYHQVKFSGENDPADIFRRLMAMKYHIARKDSDELAMKLMDHTLDEYSILMEEHSAYSTKNRKFEKKIVLESGIKHIDDVNQFIKPLPCQLDGSKSCADVDLTDRDIENLMEYWNGKKESPRRRKVSQGRVQDFQNTKDSFLTTSSSRAAPVTTSSTATAESLLKKHEKRQHFANLYQKYTKFNKNHYDEDNIRDLRDERRQEKSQQFTNSNQKFGKSYRNQNDEEENEDLQNDHRNLVPFKSAKELNSQQKNSSKPKKTLGGKPSANSQYVNPFKREKEKEDKQSDKLSDIEDERLKNIDPKMIELISNEIMDSGALVTWDDVAGLQEAKRIIKEIIVFPMLRPDIFTGLRRPPKGMLLFGPPGTGKTLIGKCIASQSKSTFFSISASSLTSKWVGEGEKMVRALFAVARVHQPSVIFIDEIDSLLTQRSETEHESSRRIKTEFLVQLDGATTGDEDRILVIGATNRPQELDEAARRRFVKRLYVPLPELEARKQIVENLLANERHELTEEDINKIAAMSDNYSGADMTNLCKEASMGPIRSISFEQLENIRKEDVRCVTANDFESALCLVRPSVSQADLGVYVQWDATYGSGTAENKSK